MNMNKYLKELSRGNNNVVIALSKTEAGKIFTPESRVEISVEARNMQFANNINNLVVKFIRVDIEGANQVLVMERLTILEPRTLEKEVRDTMYSVFTDELKQLHKAGFCHRDIRRPSGFGGRYFDNVIVTESGIRLIDVGISALKELAGEVLFNKYVEAEMKEIEEYYEYLMGQ
jgi:serine/threonine protein kinase